MADTPAQVALLPCPHCGEAEYLYPAYRVDKDGKCHSPYAIDCIGCGYDFTPREGMDVFAAWNRRASLEAGDDGQGALVDYSNLLSIIADIRTKSGLGAKPMLSELADAIGDLRANLSTANEHISRQDKGIAELVARAEAAESRLSAAQEGREAMARPKILYVCEYCHENNPEMCGHDRNDLYVTPDGRWLCEGCLEEEGISHADCASPPKLYTHPAPAQPVVKGLIEDVLDELDNVTALNDQDSNCLGCAENLLRRALSALASPTDADAAVGWRSMDSAPKDGTRILVFFDAKSDPYFDGEDRLTPYGAHAESGDFLDGSGVCVAQWVNGWNEPIDEYASARMPGWWFAWFNDDTDYVVAPTHWMPLPAEPLTAAKAGEDGRHG